MSRILVISPHPDDESIGCGGAIHRHVLNGDDVKTIFLTSGERGGHGLSPEETGKVREKEARKAARILGVEQIEFWGEPDGALRATKVLAKRLHRELKKRKPARVYVTGTQEMYSDHRAAARIVRDATKGRRGLDFGTVVLMYEVWTPLVRMDHVEDISDIIETKLAAIRAYASQCDVLRVDEAAKALARYRGELHYYQGGPYAEMFKIMK